VQAIYAFHLKIQNLGLKIYRQRYNQNIDSVCIGQNAKKLINSKFQGFLLEQIIAN